jgi:hypothetical protein
MHEEVKNRLNSGDVSYRSVQNLMYSRLLFKNLNIKTLVYKTTTYLFMYGCETWSLTQRGEWRSRVLKIRC